MNRFLLDTHTLLWWSCEPSQLSVQVLKLIPDPANEIFVSSVSLTEIAIKMNLGKLRLPLELKAFWALEQARNRFRLLPVLAEHAFTLVELPVHHPDPFDRLLLAQALAEDLILITKDAAFSRYKAPLVW